MSLVADLVDLIDGYRQPTPAAPLAAAVEPSTPTRVPYTAPGSSGISAWTAGQTMTSQLELTLAESTLFSVLELIAKKTSAVPWTAHRRTRNRKPGQEPVEILPEQNLAVQLWHQPNSFFTGKQVRQIGTWHYRAVGEAWFVVDFLDAGMTVPRAWWPVRPDRMKVKPDPDKFLTGYVYSGPSGEKIDLDPREVLRITNPHPLNPHAGVGVVQTLATILGTSMTSSQWIANFFVNDATPGGIIEIPDGLEDEDYNRLRRRWNEQHRGVGKAHRVAILEYGKFVPRSYSMKDMQFPEIRQLSRDQILEAFRIHKHNLGIAEDVNRANAEAAMLQLAENETKPNLEDWQELANGAFRRLFGAAGESIEFCYEDPSPEDREQNRADDGAKVDNFVKLIGARVKPDAAAEYLGMPPLEMVEDAPEESVGSEGEDDIQPDPAPAAPVEGELNETDKGNPAAVASVAQKLYLATEGNSLLKPVESREILVQAGAKIDPQAWEDAEPQPDPVQTADEDPVDPEQPAADPETVPAEDPVVPGAGSGVPADQIPQPGPQAAIRNAASVDLGPMAEEWQEVLDKLLDKWPGILDDQYSSLAHQVRVAIDNNDLDALLELVTPDAGAEDTLTLAMVSAAAVGANAVMREAEEQGVDIGTRVPEKADLEAQSKVVTGLMRAGLAVAAGQAAMRVLVPGASGEDVAEQVRDHLDGLTDAQPKQHLGGALTMAQNAGRFETLAVAPDATYFASEQLDSNTCTPCSKVDGKRYETLEESKEDYPTSGYRKCLGLERCRGTVVAVWETEDGDDE